MPNHRKNPHSDNAVIEVYERNKNQSKTARILGISQSSVRYIIEKYEVEKFYPDPTLETGHISSGLWTNGGMGTQNRQWMDTSTFISQVIPTQQKMGMFLVLMLCGGYTLVSLSQGVGIFITWIEMGQMILLIIWC